MTVQGAMSSQIPRSPLHKVRTNFFSIDTCHNSLSITDDTSGLVDPLYVPPGPADVADADAFEELVHNFSTPNFSNQTTVDMAPQIPELTEQYDPTEVEDEVDLTPPQTLSEEFIDNFPFGNPGMPIREKRQGLSVHGSWEAMSSGSPWAPFQSELEWNIARWVKMHGRTSSAAAELLAIPGVCASQLLITTHLTQV